MEALRAIGSRLTTDAGHPRSRILLNAARTMCAASSYCIDCGEALPHYFVFAAPEPSALARAPPLATATRFFAPTASRTRTTADGSLASPPPSSPRPTRNNAFEAGNPFQLLVTAASSVPASSSTASGLFLEWARRPPTNPSTFGTGKFLVGTSFSGTHPHLPSAIMSRCASYSTSSQDGAKSGGSEEPSITYVIGMFDDVNDPKYNPNEFADAHVLLQKVVLVGSVNDEVDKEHTVLTELAKGWFVSLPILIEKLKRHGYSFYDPVTLSQLMVDRHGQFVLADGALLRKTSKRYVSKDYVSSASVYEDIIRYRNGQDAVHHLPDSFQDFLMTLRRKRKTPHGYYMCVHPAFLPLSAYSQAYLDVYDHVKWNLSDIQTKSIHSCLQETANIWANLMKDNVLLVAWFEDPYNQTRTEDRYIIGYSKHLFIFLRHVHSHLLEYQKLLGKKYTKAEARMLVECKFSKVMSNLYWTLWDKLKLLTHIESEVYFCRPGGACCPTPGFCLRRELRLMVKPQKTEDAESAHSVHIVHSGGVESHSSTVDSTSSTQQSDEVLDVGPRQVHQRAVAAPGLRIPPRVVPQQREPHQRPRDRNWYLRSLPPPR